MRMRYSLVPNEKRLAKLKTADFALFASNVSVPGSIPQKL